MPKRKLDGVVAQLVERLVRNEKVAGSIPVGSTSLRPTSHGKLLTRPHMTDHDQNQISRPLEANPHRLPDYVAQLRGRVQLD